MYPLVQDLTLAQSLRVNARRRLLDGALQGLRADGPAAAGRRRRRAEVHRPVAVTHRPELGRVHWNEKEMSL